MFLIIHGARHDLWRAVAQQGDVLDSLVQRRQDPAAAKTFFRKLLKGLTYVLRVTITDQLQSYGAATREILPRVERRPHRSLKNRAEDSQQPTRQRERRRQGVDIGRARPTVSRRVWSHRLARPSATPPTARLRVPPSHGATIPDLVEGHGHGDGRVKAAGGLALSPVRLVMASACIR